MLFLWIWNDKMTCTAKYIESTKCLIRVWSGAVTVNDLATSYLDVLQIVNQGKHISSMLMDFSGVTENDLRIVDLLKIADSTKILSSIMPDMIFVVVAPDSSTIDLVKIWKAIALQIGWTIQVVETLERAESWLCYKLGTTSIYE